MGTRLQEQYLASSVEVTPTTARTFWGASIEVTLPELVSCELERYGLIEPGLTALFIDVVEESSIVYDVGAHLGYYSMLAAELGAEVHAFEPSDRTLLSLGRNVDGLARIVPKGVWSTDTRLELQDFGSAHSAVNTFVSSRDESLDEPDATYEVPVTSIDAYAAATGSIPTLVKIDAEGAELEVLRGAANTLTLHRPFVTIEVGDAEADPHSRRAIEMAGQLGYAPFDMTADGIRPHTPQETYSYGNVLLVPPDLHDTASEVPARERARRRDADDG